MEEHSERRRGDRLAVVLECRIAGVSNKAAMRLTDLSQEGAYIDTPIYFRPGDRVELTLLLNDVEVGLVGRVMHSQAGVGFGLAIDGTSEESRQRISDFLGYVTQSLSGGPADVTASPHP